MTGPPLHNDSAPSRRSDALTGNRHSAVDDPTGSSNDGGTTARFPQRIDTFDEPTLAYQTLPRDGKDHCETSIIPDPSGVSLGTLLQDRYRLESELGKGGFGVVFLACDIRLNRNVAVKMMLPNRSQELAQLAAAENLFWEEARLAASLHHSAIAIIFDIGVHLDRPYLVFEYVGGESLRQRMRRHPKWTLEEIRRFVLPIAEALDYAHQMRVVHRDLKPENIRVTASGEFKILDLGLARQFDQTSDWRFAGTPAYASPEQAAELPSDGRIDQYALCVILYEMLTGERPFRSSDPYKLLEMHRDTAPLHLRNFVTDVPERVAQSVLRGLSKQPAQRFASCVELAVAIGCTAPDRAFEIRQDEVVLEATVTVRSAFLIASARGNLLLSNKVLWSIENDCVREIPLASIRACSRLMGGKTLEVIFDVSAKSNAFVRYDFAGAVECLAWHDRLTELIPNDTPTAVANRSPRPMPVLSNCEDIHYQVLAHFIVEGQTELDCRQKAQLRGAIVNADVILKDDAQTKSRSLGGISQETQDVVARIEAVRSLVLFPFRPLVALVQSVASFAGADESQRRRIRAGSFLAVRATRADGRRELMTSEVRRELNTLGNWLILIVFVAPFIGYFPNVSTVIPSLRATLQVVARINSPAAVGSAVLSTLVMTAGVLAGAWPLITALAIRIRKAGLLAEPTGLTFIAWGITGYIQVFTRLSAGSNLNYRASVVYSAVLLISGVYTWRVGRRITKLIRYTDPALVLRRFAQVGWNLTIIFVLVVSVPVVMAFMTHTNAAATLKSRLGDPNSRR